MSQRREPTTDAAARVTERRRGVVMTAPAHERKVVRLTPPGTRTKARHAAGQTTGAARHAIAPGRQVPQLAVARTGRARHAAPVRRIGTRRRRAHRGLDRYDRLLLWFAGWLLSVRIALVGEHTIDES
ncbi:hypothetical protein [Nocardia mexicana]|uniref:Uncharacterized protein n=1 Tax=Nocardia mexicana TaxID=279262 RepID=A0A370GX43_9NOCA|nr:hypothetical protein [Nocardia mexicana]RDI48222.1 hypothetical protein DFR68_10851 [Nocardia mexicana]